MKQETLSRRKMLKTLAAAGGGLTAAAFLPAKWVKPVVQSGVLPVHAQASGGAPIEYQVLITLPDATSCGGESAPFTFDTDGNITARLTNRSTDDLEADPPVDGGVNGKWITLKFESSTGYSEGQLTKVTYGGTEYPLDPDHWVDTDGNTHTSNLEPYLKALTKTEGGIRGVATFSGPWHFELSSKTNPTLWYCDARMLSDSSYYNTHEYSYLAGEGMGEFSDCP